MRTPARRKLRRTPVRKATGARKLAPAPKPAARGSARKAPRAAPAARAEGRDESARPRAMAAARAGLDKKAEEVLLLDVRGLVSYADFFVVMSADSEPQAAAIADEVDRRLGALGAHKLGIEGRGGGRWVLLDYGDVVTHVMAPETRQFYDLEGLWADAPRVRVEG